MHINIRIIRSVEFSMKDATRFSLVKCNYQQIDHSNELLIDMMIVDQN